MFTSLKTVSASKLVEVREVLDFIQANSPSPPTATPSYILSCQGLFFVHLYGVYEFTIKSCVAIVIDHINNLNKLTNDLNPIFLSLTLNSNLDAIFSVGSGGTKWQKRWALFEHLVQNTSTQMSNELMPTDGKNFGNGQLTSIWKTFCIKKPIVPRPELQGRITELIRNRNDIAHGLASASEVGSLNTIHDLYLKYQDISEQCSYIINTFEDYLTNEDYLK